MSGRNMTAKVSQADADTIKAAVNILRHGGLVAMPTETVYGLAADANFRPCFTRRLQRL